MDLGLSRYNNRIPMSSADFEPIATNSIRKLARGHRIASKKL